MLKVVSIITSRGGIASSLPVVKLILQHCSCPSATAPDDMILGSCLHSLQLKICTRHGFIKLALMKSKSRQFRFTNFSNLIQLKSTISGLPLRTINS
ncbi:hypothetical protein FF38_06837 [Lucilia cuprina]|uniref:Uncharacterized protein n=1 Tax=Lucilia cuprina TaxID=7375 RepID=A0A0L0CML5_LUCCU|nr:hypothetical protein FF38_06837 [Lucilia cuprina]